jgi:hypothetical protein
MPSGDECPCGVRDFNLAKWNASHSGRWNRFRTALKRQVPSLEFFRGIEDQKRGALHDHAMVWSPVPLTEKGLKALALRAGFGHEIKAPAVRSGNQAAYYVSKYITKATDARGVVPWWGLIIDYRTGEVIGEGLVPARYRTWSCSRGYGLTMAQVKAQGAAYAALCEQKQSADNVTRLGLVAATFGGELITVHSGSPPSPS